MCDSIGSGVIFLAVLACEALMSYEKGYIKMEVFNAHNHKLYDELSASRFTEMSRGGAIAVFVYSENILIAGERRKYDEGDRTVRTIALDGAIYVPPSFFELALGATATRSDEGVTVSYGERSYTAAAYTSYGREYLSLEAGASALGLNYKSYYSGRLGVIATVAELAEIEGDERLAEAGAYVTLGTYDPYSFTPEDYKTARAKWRRQLVGSPEINDMTNPTIKTKIDDLSRGAKNIWATLNRTPDRVILFGDNPPVESEELHRQYSRLNVLARAWGTYGSELYLNEELKADIISGVEWMYNNMYGEAEIEGRGWRDAHAFNWYFWYISASEFLTNIFFIMEDEFTLEDKRRYLKCFEWCTTFMRHWEGRETALSRICVCTKVGLACEYAERLFAENIDFDELLALEKHAEGPHIDYAQWTHGQPYNTHYGKHNLDRVLHTAAMLAGTPAEFRSPKQYNQFEVVKYMFEPALYCGHSMLAFAGRSVDLKYGPHGGAILADMLKMHGMFGESEDRYIEELVRRNADSEEVKRAIINNITLELVPLFDKIFASDAPIKEYEYAHSYYTADRAVQQIKNYAFCLSLSSSREPAWESINSANKTGWYTGDGATYLYTEGDSAVFDGPNFFARNIDIAYSFPGTTEDIRERTPRSVMHSRGWRSPLSFAGSMQIKDRYIVAGMAFSSYNFAGPDDKPDDSDSGGSLPIHLNDLVAKKAWFCLEGKIVCLGAAINSTMSSPVYTTVDHRRIGKDKTVIASFGGERVELKGEYDVKFQGPGYVLIDGHAGYLVADECEVELKKYVCDAAEGQSYIRIRLSHGENPVDKGYCYIIMPYATEDMLAEYMASPTIEIKSNAKRAQKIVDSETGLTLCVFHEACDFDGIGVSEPCILALGDDFLTVCDPTHEKKKIAVTVWNNIRVTEKPKDAVLTYKRGRTIFSFNVDDAVGGPRTAKFIPFINSMYYKVDYTESEEREYAEMSADGLVSAFLYTPNVLYNGEIHNYAEGDKSVRAIARGGVAYVPVSFFSRFFGKSVKSDDGYVPALATAEKLGLMADTFYDGRLIVVGRDDQLDRIRKSELLAEAGAYAVFGKFDGSKYTSADYKIVKKRWLERLVGSPEINDLTSDIVLDKIAKMDKRCEDSLAALNHSPDRIILWGDKAPTESDDLWVQYKHIENMALPFATYGSKYYQDKAVLDTVIECIEWMYENMYGDAEIEGRGWRNVRLFNWWHWFVGAPDCLTNALLAIDDYVSLADKERYLKCYKWVRTIMYTDPKSGASSRLTPGAKCAILTEDTALLEMAQRDVDSVMTYVEYGEAVHKADYVNYTHGCPHNISYGVINLDRGLYVASIFSGTPMALETPKRYDQFNLIKYCFEPAMYRSQGFVMFSGRSTFAIEENFGISILCATLPMIGCFGEDEDRYLKSFIKRHASARPGLAEDIARRCSIYDYKTFMSLMADESIPSDNRAYEYAHAWFTGDRAAQHRNDYAVGIAVSSEREKAYECINSANKTGWYTGDGALYLYTNYDTHQFDGPNFILNNVNVAYRFPGTTEDERERVARSISSQWEHYPENSFAGGLQVDKKYLVTAMDFISFNYEGEDFHPDDYGYGGSLAPHKNDLVARKAWFCFDNEIVCLGAAINSTMSSPVNTIVEHRRVVNEDKYSQLLSLDTGVVTLPKGEHSGSYDNAKWVLMEGHAGYLPLENCSLYVGSYIEEAANGQRFFEVRVEHGENPKDATYAYAIIPYATPATLDEAREKGEIEIISNTGAVGAVRDRSCKVAGYVFYEAASADGISASAPCIVSISEEGGEYTLAITDPTHKSDSITITLDKEIEITSGSACCAVAIKGGITQLTFNTFMSNGRRYEVKFK